MAVEFGISNWSGWTTPGLAAASSSAVRISPTPDASAIPALLRRRLNTLGRAAAAEMLRLPAAGSTPVVYSSRHGDIERTLGVLLELADGEPVSPMNFSLAVHNAIPGILSIHSGNTANITSLAAIEESLVPALLEANGLLQEGYEQVFCLFVDVPVPEIYRTACGEPAAPYAASFLIRAAGGNRFSLRPSGGAPPEPADYVLPEALRFVDYLDTTSARFETCHNDRLWIVARH